MDLDSRKMLDLIFTIGMDTILAFMQWPAPCAKGAAVIQANG